MKAIKPTSLGLLHKPYRFRGQDRLVIAALGFFRLGGDAAALLAEQDAWPDVVQRLPAEQPLDMMMPKVRGEVLAAATAHAPAAVTEMTVALQVGPIAKRLRVVGDRQWFYGTVPLHGMTAPQPFTRMPIDYRRAYGGPEHAGNPTGVGHTGRRFGALIGENIGAMPNLEYPDQPVTGHHKPLPPAGFGPLDVRWSPRRERAGTYDQGWLDEQAPGLPLDIDWSVFNAAPADQQLAGYFEGGEAYRLEGLHPERAAIAGRLPDLRVRAFLQRRDGNAPEEIPLVFDTVWFFPDAELGLALYRGQADVADSEAADAQALLLAYERRGDPPRPAAHYRQALALRLGTGKEALVHLINEAPLRPEPDAAARARAAAERGEAEARQAEESQARVAAALAEMGDALPDGFAPPPVEPPPFGVIPAAALARGEADLSGLFARIDARAEEARAAGEANLAALAAQQRELRASLGQDSADAAPVDDDIDAALARAHGLHHRERAALLADAGRAGGEALPSAEKLAEQNAELDRQGRRAAQQPVPVALGAGTAAALGAEVRRLLAAGESLAGRDLAGAALAGIDLAGADLKGTLLERADLTGADLRGADLGGAVLAGAVLRQARFDDACLDGASLNRAEAAGASFKRIKATGLASFHACFAQADLSGARLESWLAVGVDLSGARLDQAELGAPLLLQAAASGSRWRGAQLRQALLIRSQLAGADFGGARLTRCVFADSTASKAAFRAAHIEQCFFGGAELAGADFTAAAARQSSWRQGALAGAILAGGRFAQCDFGGANLEAGDLRGAAFAAAIMSRARLAGCDGRDSEWFQAQCRQTDFRQAELRQARFMQADLSEARFAHARLADARHLPAKLDTRTGAVEAAA